MFKLSKLFIGAGAALALSACGQTQNTAATAPPPAPPVDQAAEAAKARIMQQDANQKVIESLYMPGITLDQRLALMAPDFIQHNPEFALFDKINNVEGRDGFKLAYETLSKLRGGGNPLGSPPGAAKGPQPPAGNPLYKVMADGDIVTVIHENYRLQPGTKDMFYPVYGYDAYRVQNGLMAEHWDGATLPDKLPIYLRVPVSKLKFPKQTNPAG